MNHWIRGRTRFSFRTGNRRLLAVWIPLTEGININHRKWHWNYHRGEHSRRVWWRNALTFDFSDESVRLECRHWRCTPEKEPARTVLMHAPRTDHHVDLRTSWTTCDSLKSGTDRDIHLAPTNAQRRLERGEGEDWCLQSSCQSKHLAAPNRNRRWH